MKLPKGCYVFSSVKGLSLKKPNSLKRFGVDWVVWRNQEGQWIAQKDRCPHRSARLSLGKIKGNCIECPFHGFRFDSSGGCSFVPEIGRSAPGVKIESHFLIDQYGYLWIYWGGNENQKINWFSELENSGFTSGTATQLWHTHFSRCVENQLDYAHLPFVHSNSIGKNFDPAIKMSWIFEKESIRGYLGMAGPSTGYFEFRYPNVWKLQISPNFAQTLAFVPVDEHSTLIYSRSYHRITQLPLIRQCIAWMSAKIANPYILSQDRRVVLDQAPVDVREAQDESLFPSDRGIIQFRAWLGKIS